MPCPEPEKGDQKVSAMCNSQQQTSNSRPPLSFDFGESPLSEEWKEKITKKLNSFSDVFSHNDLDFGHATHIKHHINLKDETPFKQRSRPIHPHDYEAVKKHLQALLDAGIIRESESPFSSPIVVVHKKNGDVRLCIDFRKLNLQTIRDAYALPNLEESFSALAGSQWFSVMDLKSGYYQIEMCEEDKPKTAFVCPFGFYEFNRMPQGITNAPSTFQRLMEKCMKDINLKEVLVFLDDLIVFSSSLEDHETRLIHVLERLREYGLKLSPDKCRFFQTSVRYLGHIVSRDGVKTDPEKTEALKTWPRPQTLKELQSFLGFTGYYRRFVKDYSKIVKPLTSLTAGYPPRRKHCKNPPSDPKYLNPKEPFGDRWGPECQKSFQTIIEKLTTSPVLGYADAKLPYLVHTDASTTGLGAALYQVQNGTTQVIAYASRGLSRSEARYPAHKLEFLALKWAITDKFHDYLYGNTFTVITDNNPLTYLLTTAKLDATSYRWLAALSTYNFDIKYRAGRQNLDADGLSRKPHAKPEDDPVFTQECQRIDKFRSHLLSSVKDVELQLQSDTVMAACQRHMAMDQTEPSCALVQSLAMSAVAIPDMFQEEGIDNNLLALPRYTHTDLVNLQRKDPAISEVIKLLAADSRPPANTKSESHDVLLLLREWKRLDLQNDLLYRKRQLGPETLLQLVLPDSLRHTVMLNLHDNMGHLGVERTLELIRSRFYWPKMAIDVEKKVKACERCVRRKALPDKAAPLVNIKTSRPMELVCMDFLSIEPDSKNTKDVLVITDHFTKYAVSIPTKDQKATTVAKNLWENFLVHYGFPERLHSDQGRDFESRTIKELCSLLGIRKVRTSPYHPRGNPVERYNRTLLSMLGTLKDTEKHHWRDFVKPLTHAYNCTKNDVTGYSPYELMFGRQPRLPIDIAFGLPQPNKPHVTHSQYVKQLKSYLEQSYEIAIKNSQKVADKNKKRFDKIIRESTLDVGDQVLVRNLRLREKHKLADKWEQTVYIVTKQMENLPVYTVKPENGDGPNRTLHRDLLLPCGFLSPTEHEPEQVTKTNRPRTRQISALEVDSDQTLEEEEDEFYYPEPPQVKDRHFYQVCAIPPTQGFKQNKDPVNDNERSNTLPDMTDLPGKETENETETYLPEQEIENETETYLPEQETENETETYLPDGEIGSSTNTNLPQMDSETDLPPTERGSEANLRRSESDTSLQNNTPSESETDTRKDKNVLSTSLSDSPLSENSTHQLSPERQVENDDEPDTLQTETQIRRSERIRQPSQRLTYPQLGNPLVTVVKSLFQGLNKAFIDSLANDVDYSTRTMHGDVHEI
uniref:Gypsy retrotransposon integrase-like protein 1 n=1 Tax=Oreochromis niloticus TaxID=8128 RepID=A0A669DKA6_ORENI